MLAGSGCFGCGQPARRHLKCTTIVGVFEMSADEWHTWWSIRAGDRTVQHGRWFVLSADELHPLGISRQQARTRVRRGDWVGAGYGYVAPIDIRDPRPYVVRRRRHAVQSTAAARRRRGHVVSGRSVAILHGLPTFRVPDRPELTAVDPVGLGRHRGTSHIYGATLTPGEQAGWFGCPATTIARTLVDLGRHDRWDAIMAADAALCQSLTSAAGIDRALEAAAGWPGVRQARTVLLLASPDAESPLESITRLRLHEGGFPAPRLQVWIGRDRVDMLFEEHGLILEMDGLAKYSDEEWRREKRREVRLRKLGYRIERVTWDDVVNRWPETRGWLRDHLRLPARAGWNPSQKSTSAGGKVWL